MVSLSPLGALFVAIASLAILFLPRKWAAAPLLVGVCYLVLGQGIAIGPFNFFAIRILILVGFMRVLVRKEGLPHGLNSMDWLMLVWAAWALAASVFRDSPGETFVANLGLAGNACGVYFLLRIFITSPEDVKGLCRIVSILLVPIAIEMILEQVTAHNLFSLLGGADYVPFREGRLRARGPFAHPILAGTVGAVFLPMVLSLWRTHRKTAIVGVTACVTMVITSASSGPLLSAAFALVAVFLWRYREHTRAMRWGAIFAYAGLAIVMKAPVYFLIARIDLTGGSTGWHRAQLIDSALRHFSEWWLAGTDYTRHWMPTGVSWSPRHTDITNHYILLGVDGGLLLTVLFIAVLWKGFSMVGEAVRRSAESSDGWGRFYWAIGASLFAHTATMISVAYFDQSFVVLYLTLAAAAAVHGHAAHQASPAPVASKRFVPIVRPGQARTRGRGMPTR